MYEAFFGFSERPFQLTPNPRFLFLNPAHREALATLRYGLRSSLGITLLLGDAGTGKTTLLHAALHAERRPEHRFALLSNPTLTVADFYEILAEAFGLPGGSGSKGRFLVAFERNLLERHRAGGLTALIIDEAQTLSLELFEEIRLLANLETVTTKLVNVVLVGQRELAGRLNDPTLRQFKQRVILRCALPPLDLESTASYIAMRLRVAGANAGDVFTKDAVGAIYEASQGIPRVIGVVCENALLAGYAAERKPIDRAIIAAVCRDFDIPVNGNGQPPREGRAAQDAGVAARDPAIAARAQRVAASEQKVAAPDPGTASARETEESQAIRLRLRRSRPLFASRSGEPRPEPAKENPETTPVPDRRRMFDFF
jgi:general secretion pathway protein A